MGTCVIIAGGILDTSLQLTIVKADITRIGAIVRKRDLVRIEKRFMDWFYS